MKLTDRLGMTEEQILLEMETMRMWDRYLRETLGMDKWNELMRGFSKILASAKLKALGATDEQIEEATEFASAMMIADEMREKNRNEESQ